MFVRCCAYACLCMFFLFVCVCACQQVQLAAQCVYIFLPGTAALRPASPEAKECPLFLLLLLLPAPLTLLAHALSGAAGTSAQPRPSRPAGRVGRMNQSTLTWTGTRSGSWERIHNGKMLRPVARKSRGGAKPASLQAQHTETSTLFQ